MDHFTAGERVIVAQVPTQGVPTLYPIIGDAVGWLAIAGFVIIAAWAIIAGWRPKPTAKPVGRPMPV